MTTRRSLALKGPLARMAVAGAASLATVLATAPMAVAVDEQTSGANTSQADEPKADEPPPAEETAPDADEKTDEPAVEEKVEPKPEVTPEAKPDIQQDAEQDEQDGADERTEEPAAEEDVIVPEDESDDLPERDDTVANDDPEEGAPAITVQVDDADGIDIDVLTNDSDVRPGDFVTIKTNPTAGTATPNSDAEQTVNYTPDGSTTGTVTFEYEIMRPVALNLAARSAAVEELSEPVDSATVTVTVTEVPAATLDAVDDPSSGTINVTAGGSKVIDVLANDTFQPGDTITPASGPGQSASKGLVMLTTDDSGRQVIQYSAFPGTTGTDTFSYTLTRPTDSEVQPSDTAQVTVNIVEDETPIEPGFGLQKFRVGVQSTDASFSSAGSELRVVVKAPSGETVYDEPCVTTAESQTDDNTTYCDGLLNDDSPLQLSAARTIDEPANTVPEEQTFPLPPGFTARITQTKAAAGLVRERDAVDIDACDANDPIGFACLTGVGENRGLKATTALFVNSPPADDDSDVEDSTATDDDTTADRVLPDTGAPSLGLLGLGGLLAAAGATLAARGRRESGRNGDPA